MKLKLLIILSCIFYSFSFAQNVTVNGNVTEKDGGFPIPTANIILKNTTRGVVTDFDGNFTFTDVPIGSTLVISYVGFITQEVVINSAEFLSIQLETDVATLDEVVVIGYGTQRKKEITGAVGIVSNETIEDLKPTRVEQALQGQVAGVQVNANSGSPGSGSTISIRGISTNGDNRPLILLDGAVIEELSVINPNDIESVNILKDATAGIYGVRAANGVILIKTKTGRKNTKTTFEYSGYSGIQQTTRKIPVLNATEYALLVNEAFAANGDNLQFTDVSNLGQGTDWQDQVFENAFILDHSITVRGGNEKSTYAFSSSFLTQDGIVGGKKSNFSRFTKRINYSIDLLENLKANASLLYTHTNRKVLPENGIGSVLYNALNMDPTVGRFGRALGLGGEVINPLAQIASTFNRAKVDKITGVAGLSYNFLDHFSIQTNIQTNWSRVNDFTFRPITDFGFPRPLGSQTVDTVFDNVVSEINVGESYFRDYTFDAFINYENSFSEAHNLKLLLGMSVFQTTGSFGRKIGRNIPGNVIQNATLDQAGSVENLFRNRPGGRLTFDSRLLSYFVRAQYDYKGKYLLSAVIRRDGSTKFGPKNKFGIFPSGSVGWIVSNESFLEDSKTINFLKFRGSYGILGNDRIPDFSFVSLLSGEGTYVFDNQLFDGAALGVISNPEIRWERQKAFDVGVDLKLLDNKVDITADYFIRKTEDLLLSPSVSGILGASAPGSGVPVVNAGTVENKGLEFAIGYADKIGDDFKFNIRYNITTLENQVLSVGQNGDPQPCNCSFGVGQEPPAFMEEGLPIGYFRGYRTDGIFQNQAEVDAYPTLNDAVQPGDLRFVDINNDGLIDDNDKTYIGDPIADATMGLNIKLDYKNFDFGAYAFASLGNEIVRNYERGQQLTNRTVYALDRWTGQGTSNSVPRVTNGANSNSLFSDYFVEDGSFVRLQNIQLGYTFSDKILKHLGASKLRIYVSANNLFTLTEYRGYDPTISNGPPVGTGIDSGFYPSAKTFLFGANLKF